MFPDGLLQAILSEPGDDSVRLVAADWLDEHGQPGRAEFIRLQVALARRPNDDACRAACRPPHFSGCPERRLLQRERELWRHHGCDWEADVRDALRTGRRLNADPLGQALRCEWRRGFVWRVAWNCADFFRHAGVLFRCQPVEAVTLSDCEPDTTTNRPRWTWLPDEQWRRRQAAPPWCLPWRLYDLIAELRDKNVAETPDDCRRWLSRACVAFGRDEARKFRHAR
jgi:uncharacterized protein (TIGR02996 family)